MPKKAMTFHIRQSRFREINMNLLLIQNILQKENKLLKLQSELQKEKDEKKQDDMKMEIIKLNGQILEKKARMK